MRRLTTGLMLCFLLRTSFVLRLITRQRLALGGVTIGILDGLNGAG
jgi:hypothetical protein